MRRWAGRGLSLAVAMTGLVGGVGPVAGQSQDPPVDSARLRILERLQRLARPVGADSVLFLQDSARMADAAVGVRPSTPSGDEVTSEILAIPGYTLTEYDGATADFAAGERVLVLRAPPEGRARVAREGMAVEADSSIVFNESSGRLRTYGMSTMTPADGDAVDAAEMIYDLTEARGSAYGAVTSFNQDGAEWRVVGEMPYASQDSTFMSHAQFSSCEDEEPHYHFTTNEIKIVGGSVLVARGVRLYFADVPVAWLPFMAQSLARGRASGILTPRFSVNDIVRTSGGYRRRVSNIGFYWAMGQYSDALVAADWFSDTFTAVTGAFRYRFNRQFLSGDLNVRRYWGADGSTEFAMDTRHAWDVDERTNLTIAGRYVTNNDFVRENSFNPLEVTQSIDSNAGLRRRFDWGSLTVASNRKEYLSDDRTEWTLPQVNLSLSPITLFAAPTTEAHFFNNMTWSGSGAYQRSTLTRMQPDTFDLSSANTANTTSRASSSLRVGGFTFSQSANLRQSETMDVPEALLVVGDSVDPAELMTGVPARDIIESSLGWSATVNYQQQLIGSTTLTPRFSMSGDLFRSDTDTLANDFVSGPTRMSFGAQLKTDVYGFFPGFGSFERLRHKLSPSFDYEWSPETRPTPLQEAVFGRRAVQPRNRIAVTLAQTFEARRESDEDEQAAPPEPDTAAAAAPGGPRRLQTPDIVTLLALRTSVVEYDFVQADEVGTFVSGFETTQLSNTISSDYLRGLSVSLNHDLFEDELAEDGTIASRSFDPHLAQMNLSFSLGSSSSIFRWLGLAGGGEGEEEPEEPDPEDPFDLPGPTEESMVVPVSGRDAPIGAARGRTGSAGGWSANLSYSLQRPRDPERPSSKMLSGSLRLEPTRNWSASWRTAYDIDAGQFNDHTIRLTRDLHRWQANFDFLQTATGNWTFRFEVSLLDNRDLKFDYNQRNLDLGLPTEQR